MKLTKSKLKQLIKEELALIQEIGAPEDPLAAYGDAQAEAGAPAAYAAAWGAYKEGMQELTNLARNLGNDVGQLYRIAHKDAQIDHDTKEAFRQLMLLTRVSGHYGKNTPKSFIETIQDYMRIVDEGLKAAGSRGPTDMDYVHDRDKPAGDGGL